MTEEEAVLTKMGFTVAVNEHGRWVAVKGQRRVYGDTPAEILETVRADYRPGKEA